MEFFNDIGSNQNKPSIFELVAQEQLRDLLQPAVKYVLSVFAQSYPRYLLRLVNRHEEFYALIMFFVERHYLKTAGASFAENFYGLKRRRRPTFETERANIAVGPSLDKVRLRKREIRLSLIFLVLLPYIRAKAQDFYESLGGGVDPSILEGEGVSNERSENVSTTSRLKEIFKRVYPWLNATFEVWLTIYNVAYLFNYTPYYRPWMSWMGIDLRRVGADDLNAMAASNAAAASTPNKRRSIRSLIFRLIIAGPSFLMNSFNMLLPTAIIFVKFLEWWYSSSSPARSLTSSSLGPLVPAPPLLKPHPQGVPIDKEKYGQCPLCHDLISNATVLPSGYVFCYRCAYDYVEQHNKCPVTFLPCQISQLRKVLT